MSDNSVQQTAAQPATMEQVLAHNEYLSATVDVLQAQLAETTHRLTQAQVSATVFRSKMNMLGTRVNELQDQLAAARAAVPASSNTPAVAAAAVAEPAAVAPLVDGQVEVPPLAPVNDLEPLKTASAQ